MSAPSMLVLGKEPAAIRSVCRSLSDLGVQPRVEWSSTNLVCSVEQDTLGIVVVDEDEERATRVCRSLRRWAHESVFPIVVLSSRTDSVPLWRAATTVLRWHQDCADFARVVTHLREHAVFIPPAHDVLDGWMLRDRLRTEPSFRYPMTFEPYVAGGGVLLSGLVSDHAQFQRAREIVAGLTSPRTVCTAGLCIRGDAKRRRRMTQDPTRLAVSTA